MFSLSPSSENLFKHPSCFSCQQEISDIGIECSVCPNNLQLCCECFGLGAEINMSSGTCHKPDHNYHFFNSNGGVKIFKSSQWSVKEHIKLLDAIEQYGFGNWQDISKFIETKTPTEAKEEYVFAYVNRNLGQIWNSVTKNEKAQRPIDYTVTDSGPLSPQLLSKLPELEISQDEAAQLGYMPKRDDYEKEFDNEAEKLVSQLVFSPEDDEVEVALKLSLVDIFTRRLRERVRRKRVIRDYQLVGQFFKKDRPISTKRFQAFEKEIMEKFKPFAQFHSSLEHHHFIQNLVREKELRFRLQELFKYRRNGITKISETGEYERCRARRRLKVALPTVTEEEKESLMKKSLSSSTTVKKMQQQQQPRNVDVSVVGCSLTKSPTLRPFSCVATNSNSVGLPSALPTLRQLMEEEEEGGKVGVDYSLLKGGEREDLEDPSTVSNIQNHPAASLLIPPETELCLSISMDPLDYITCKTVLINSPDHPCPNNLSHSSWTKIKKLVHRFM